jgi:hypothetical protein
MRSEVDDLPAPLLDDGLAMRAPLSVRTGWRREGMEERVKGG